MIEKSLVVKNFNAAADHYNSAAVLQKSVAEQMYERLELIRLEPNTILDLGSGTGLAARQLARLYGKARIVQLDFALQMLTKSVQLKRWFEYRQSFVCADAARLPFTSGVFEMIFSNLMLQWCNDLESVFTEVRRALKPRGFFMFSSFGPDTLRELKSSWSAVDKDTHVNGFIDMHDIGDALVRAGFEQPVLETEIFTLTYPAVDGVFRDLKLLGATNVNAGRRHTLTGKGRLAKVVKAYADFRVDNKIPATYEVIYGHAWRGSADSRHEKDNSVHLVPVASIKRSGR